MGVREDVLDIIAILKFWSHLENTPGPHTSNYIFRKNVVFTYYFDFLNVKNCTILRF